MARRNRPRPIPQWPTLAEYRVYHYLHQKATAKSRNVMASREEIATGTNLTKRAVTGAITRLISRKWIRRQKLGRRGNPTIYRLLSALEFEKALKKAAQQPEAGRPLQAPPNFPPSPMPARPSTAAPSAAERQSTSPSVGPAEDAAIDDVTDVVATGNHAAAPPAAAEADTVQQHQSTAKDQQPTTAPITQDIVVTAEPPSAPAQITPPIINPNTPVLTPPRRTREDLSIHEQICNEYALITGQPPSSTELFQTIVMANGSPEIALDGLRQHRRVCQGAVNRQTEVSPAHNGLQPVPPQDRQALNDAISDELKRIFSELLSPSQMHNFQSLYGSPECVLQVLRQFPGDQSLKNLAIIITRLRVALRTDHGVN